MKRLRWNDFGIRHVSEEKQTWCQKGSLVDPFGNPVTYHIQLGADESGQPNQSVEIYKGNLLLVSVFVFLSDIDSDEKLTALIDSIFEESYYKSLMGNPKVPRYQHKNVEVVEATLKEHITAGEMGQFLVDLDTENPPTEGQLIDRYTRELQVFLAL